jgi:hypothetical protein
MSQTPGSLGLELRAGRRPELAQVLLEGIRDQQTIPVARQIFVNRTPRRSARPSCDLTFRAAAC